MSFYLQVDGIQVDQIASNTGWGDFGRWAKLLDPDQFGEVRSLYENGWTDEPAKLMDELGDASKDENLDADCASVVSAIIITLEGRENSEVVSVTDGMGKDDDSLKASLRIESVAPNYSEISLDKIVDPKHINTEDERNRRKALLLLLLGYFAWQVAELLDKSGILATHVVFNDRLAKILREGMTREAIAALSAGPVAPTLTTPPIGPLPYTPKSPWPKYFPAIEKEAAKVAADMAVKLNQTTAKNIETAMTNGASKDEAIDAAIRKATERRAVAIEDDMTFVGTQIENRAVAEVDEMWLIWRTQMDELVCGRCGPLDGITVKAGKPFVSPDAENPDGIWYPVISTHARCRCEILSIMLPKTS